MSGWRKSARSGGNGQCVEVGSFRKASHSVNNGQCAEVGSAPGAVLVRDTTDRGGVTLAVSPGAWRAFLGALRGGAVTAVTPEPPAGEVRTCYCGMTATVVPGVFPHDDCDGSVPETPAVTPGRLLYERWRSEMRDMNKKPGKAGRACPNGQCYYVKQNGIWVCTICGTPG